MVGLITSGLILGGTAASAAFVTPSTVVAFTASLPGVIPLGVAAAPDAVNPAPSPPPPYAPSPAVTPFCRSSVTNAVPPPTIAPAIIGLITPCDPITKAAPANVGRMSSRNPASGSPVEGLILRLLLYF